MRTHLSVFLWATFFLPDVLWASQPALNWNYDTKSPKGPARWGTLQSEYATCASGSDQSPVNLSKPSQGEGDKLQFFYHPAPVVLLNTGHGLQFKYTTGSYFENGRSRYELLQFHFHNPSEHTLEGKVLPMEMHLVHKDVQNGRLAVVGVFFKEGTQNDALEPIFSPPQKPGDSLEVSGLFLNIQNVLPKSQSYFYYPGSLTTPPCSEGVSWHVFSEPIEASKTQISRMQKAFGVTSRPIQKLGNRILRFQK
jgi:carbonic anhydrase